MFLVERLNKDTFEYDGEVYTRCFPEEYLIAVEQGVVIGYARINVLDATILEISSNNYELNDMLFRYAVATIESLGDDEFYFSKHIDVNRYKFCGKEPYNIDQFFKDNKQCK